MSTATELAELEAAIADADLTPEESAVVKQGVQETGVPIAEAIALVLELRSQENGNGDGDTDAGELGPKELEALDKERTRHLGAIRRIVGEMANELEDCTACDGMGLAPRSERVEPATHPYFKRCETCNGLGGVLTGSLVQGKTTAECPECRGRGYLEALGPDGSPLATSNHSGPVPATIAAPAELAPSAASSAEQASGEVRFGVPAWMGDPTLGQ